MWYTAKTQYRKVETNIFSKGITHPEFPISIFLNVEIWIEAAIEFLFAEYIYGTFIAVYCVK
jgi:hypothetical protein